MSTVDVDGGASGLLQWGTAKQNAKCQVKSAKWARWRVRGWFEGFGTEPAKGRISQSRDTYVPPDRVPRSFEMTVFRTPQTAWQTTQLFHRALCILHFSLCTAFLDPYPI